MIFLLEFLLEFSEEYYHRYYAYKKKIDIVAFEFIIAIIQFLLKFTRNRSVSQSMVLIVNLLHFYLAFNLKTVNKSSNSRIFF